jgi:hypothetical protein
MAWVSAILGLLKSMPRLLDYAEQLSRAVIDFVDQERIRKAKIEFDKAAAIAKDKHDTQRLEDIFKGDAK